MRRRLSSESGSAVIISMMVIAAMLGLGLATFGFVDSQTKLSGYERNDESAFTYSEGVLGLQSYLISTSWPGKSTQARPDCSFDGASVTATGGFGGVAMCPAAAQLASSFPPSDYAGVKWTVRVRDNGGTEKCALTNQMLCSYYYDDTALAGQPSWDANADGQVWLRAQSLYRRDRRTLVERVRLDQQPVSFPEAVITAGHLYLKESPHLKVVTNYSPINLRCAINTSGCLVMKKKKQVAPYRINYSYPNQSAISPSALELLRQRAKNEGWWYATCPIHPTGLKVFVENGACTGASLPSTTPTARGTYIQVGGTLKWSGREPPSPNLPKGRKGNYWGLIYHANTSPTGAHLSSDVITIEKGKRLIRGVISIDYNGGFSLGGSKDTLVEYDPFVIEGLYLYAGSTLVHPSFREIRTNTP